jgi:xanthine dehydrogenase molybdopterin-binding subunit B
MTEKKSLWLPTQKVTAEEAALARQLFVEAWKVMLATLNAGGDLPGKDECATIYGACLAVAKAMIEKEGDKTHY